MNLYELAHHPDAFTDVFGIYSFVKHSTKKQMDLLNVYTQGIEFPVNHLNDPELPVSHNEMEYRMHLLFVYFATTPESEWP
jgi:hypothetical protein